MVKEIYAIAGGRGPADIIAFIVVFVVILALAYFAARLVGKQAVGRAKGKYIEVVDALGLGQDARLYIVKAGGGFFLLSKCGKSVTLLGELDPALMDDAVAESAAKSGASRRGAGVIWGSGGVENFADKLKRMLSREPAPEERTANTVDKEKSDA